MSKRNLVVLFMDDIHHLCYERDSTLLIGKEAQKNGFDIVYVRSDSMVVKNSKLVIYGQGVELLDSVPYFSLKSENLIPIDLSSIYVMLLRQNPPCDVKFISNLQFLSKIHNSKEVCMVVNPDKLISLNEKLIPAMVGGGVFPSFVLTSNDNLAYDFLLENKKVVLKPMNECSGMGVVIVSLEDKNFFAIWSLLSSKYNSPIIVQKFIPNGGDKRVIISNGKIIAAMKRVPAEFDFRSNLCLSAVEEKTELTDKEVFISGLVAKFMKENDILWSGIDLINEHLIEVNITSPTGLISMNKLYNANFEQHLWIDIENYVSSFYKV